MECPNATETLAKMYARDQRVALITAHSDDAFKVNLFSTTKQGRFIFAKTRVGLGTMAWVGSRLGFLSGLILSYKQNIV